MSPGAGRVAPGAARSDSRTDATEPEPEVRSHLGFGCPSTKRARGSAGAFRWLPASKHRPCWGRVDCPVRYQPQGVGPGRSRDVPPLQGSATPAPSRGPHIRPRRGRQGLTGMARTSVVRMRRAVLKIEGAHVFGQCRAPLAGSFPECADVDAMTVMRRGEARMLSSSVVA